MSEEQLIEYWEDFTGRNSQEDIDKGPVSSSDSEAEQEVEVIRVSSLTIISHHVPIKNLPQPESQYL